MQHDTTDIFCLYVTTRNAVNFQHDIPSIPVDNFKEHYIVVFDLTSMQDATEHRHYPKTMGEPLRLELYLSSPLKIVTEVVVLNVCLLLQSTSSVLCEKIFEMDNTSLKQTVNRIPLLKYRHIRSFPSDFVPNITNDTLAIFNTQPSNTPGQHWIMIAKFHQELYFTDSLGLSINNYPFLMQNYSQMVRTRLQDHPIVCGFYTSDAAFPLFGFQQEEITSVHDVIVLSLINGFMQLITNLL